MKVYQNIFIVGLLSLFVVHCSSGSGNSSETSLATPDNLISPAAGEWPLFKRNLAHTGLVDDMTGGITNANLCEKWSRQVTASGTRANSGTIIASINGTETVFVAVSGNCDNDESNCTAEGPGTIYALNGTDGSVIWQTRLPGNFQADVYAPLLADIDGDDQRELIVPANGENQNQVYAIRTEAESAGAAGSTQWIFTFDEEDTTSEAAPAAYDLDGDGVLEILIGTGGQENAATFYAIDGATGLKKGDPVSITRRVDLDHNCSNLNKIDSSSPAVAIINGTPIVFVGAWDGNLYSFQWDVTNSRLILAGSHELPTNDELECSIPKVRNSPAIAQVVAGGEAEIVFGYMYEIDDSSQDYETARLRIIDASSMELIQELEVNDWKSSPSLADIDTSTSDMEITGGFYEGVYLSGSEAGTFSQNWAADIGDGTRGGNRSSPIIADINGDGNLDVLLGIEGEESPGFYAYDGPSGTVLWNWEAPETTGDAEAGVAASASAGDIDGDGSLEVTFLGLDGVVYALDNNCN